MDSRVPGPNLEAPIEVVVRLSKLASLQAPFARAVMVLSPDLSGGGPEAQTSHQKQEKDEGTLPRAPAAEVQEPA
jgi:hypothetical protein